jgi:hypothetical protein
MTTKAAVLVNLTIGSFSNERTDAQATADVAKLYSANRSAGRYIRKRLPDEVLTRIKTLQRDARKYHYQVASPWMDGGIRIMAAKFIPKALAYYKTLDMQIKGEVAQIATELPAIKAAAKKSRKALYHESDFPTPEQLEEAFRIELEFIPVPLAEDFRIDFISNKIKKDMTKKNSVRFEAQTTYVKGQILELLYRLQRNLVQEAPRIRSSTIDQLAWFRDNMKELLLDENKLDEIKEPMSRIDQVILQEFDEDARPKFNPLAIDEAVLTVEQTIKDLS